MEKLSEFIGRVAISPIQLKNETMVVSEHLLQLNHLLVTVLARVMSAIPVIHCTEFL
jgi:hypothetical protein